MKTKKGPGVCSKKVPARVMESGSFAEAIDEEKTFGTDRFAESATHRAPIVDFVHEGLPATSYQLPARIELIECTAYGLRNLQGRDIVMCSYILRGFSC
jgi:phospholipid N-methyltransferase